MKIVLSTLSFTAAVAIAAADTQEVHYAARRGLAGHTVPLQPERECSKDSPCGECEGDCRNDSECADGLVCYIQRGRPKSEAEAIIPGCSGLSFSRTDYCIDRLSMKATEVMDQAPSSTDPYTIALWGDLPYRGDTPDVFTNGPEDEYGEIYTDLVNAVNEAEPAFVIHSGDVKGGGASCGELSYRRFEDMMNAFNAPGFLSLGDNDWLDCHRLSNGNYDPLDLLQDVRVRFYDPSGDTVFGNAPPLKSVTANDDYPEVQLFVYGNVMYINGHILGTNNGLYDGVDVGCDSYLSMIDPDCQASNAESIERTQVTNEWVSEGFRLAKKMDLSAVMVIIQANIFGGPCGEWPNCDTSQPVVVSTGFTDFWENLVKESLAFEKPVALFHGDYHYYQVFENPDGRAENLVAVQNPGSGSIGWIKTTVDPTSDSVFTFEHVDHTRPTAELQTFSAVGLNEGDLPDDFILGAEL